MMVGPVHAAPGKVTEVTLTVPTDAQDDNDVIAATQVIEDIARRNGGTILLKSIVVLDKDDQGIEMDLVFLRSNVALGTEDAAVSITDDNAEEIVGIVNVPTSAYADLVNSQVAVVDDINLIMVADGSSPDLYIAAVTRGTPTYASGEILLKLGYEQYG